MAPLNVEMQKLGARGISVMFASGDSGASCSANGNAFSPDFPAELPSVTAVGGVAYAGGAWEADSISGGGFSNKFAQPAWQAKAVQAYLKSASSQGILPPASYFKYR
jgi:tripeptidyl-peptidase-1